MRKGDIIVKVEFESVTDPVTKVTTGKKFERTRRCVAILEGNVDPVTKLMKYTDVSNKDLDMVELANPDVAHNRYVIKYDNISEVEIP